LGTLDVQGGAAAAPSAYQEDQAFQLARSVILSGGKRMLVSAKDLYIEHDRLQSEAEFRDAIGLPGLCALALVLWNLKLTIPTEISALAVGALLYVVLFIQARALDREAYSMHGHAVADGMVSTSRLDQLRDDASHLEQ